MRQPQQQDDEVMYTAWVLAGRNGNVAAKQLGMKPGTFRHHVRTNNWEKRYQAEVEAEGSSVRRLAIAQAMVDLPLIYDRLKAIALGTVEQIIGVSKDGDAIYGPPAFRDQVGAAQAIIRSLPALPDATQQRPIQALTLVDARNMQHATPIITEVEQSGTEYSMIDYSTYDELPDTPSQLPTPLPASTTPGVASASSTPGASSVSHSETDAESYVSDQIAQRMSQ